MQATRVVRKYLYTCERGVDVVVVPGGQYLGQGCCIACSQSRCWRFPMMCISSSLAASVSFTVEAGNNLCRSVNTAGGSSSCSEKKNWYRSHCQYLSTSRPRLSWSKLVVSSIWWFTFRLRVCYSMRHAVKCVEWIRTILCCDKLKKWPRGRVSARLSGALEC